MTITFKLPDSKKEAAFILQLLQKLNLVIVQTDETDEVSEIHKRILDERLEKLRTDPNAQFYSWEEVKSITSKRKINS